jgi:hypothetical protein
LLFYVMNAAGSGRTNFSNDPQGDITPTWSPDGLGFVYDSNYIAFVSNRDGNFEIYVMIANGVGQRRLTNNAADDTASAWQPMAADCDLDSVANAVDNCSLLANATQLDSDGDGYGNACDAELNNSALVTTADFGLLRSVLNQTAASSPMAAAADLSGSGTVTTADFAILRPLLNTAPGPSGYVCAGIVPCP